MQVQACQSKEGIGLSLRKILRSSMGNYSYFVLSGKRFKVISHNLMFR